MRWLLLPLAVGQLARPWLGGWAAKNNAIVNRVDRGTILLLVYTSFCGSVAAGVWTGHGTTALIVTAVAASLLFFAVLGVTARVSERDRLAARRPHRRDLLRVEKDARGRRADGPTAFRRPPRRRPDPAADHDLSPVATGRLRLARRPLGSAIRCSARISRTQPAPFKRAAFRLITAVSPGESEADTPAPSSRPKLLGSQSRCHASMNRRPPSRGNGFVLPRTRLPGNW